MVAVGSPLIVHAESPPRAKEEGASAAPVPAKQPPSKAKQPPPPPAKTGGEGAKAATGQRTVDSKAGARPFVDRDGDGIVDGQEHRFRRRHHRGQGPQRRQGEQHQYGRGAGGGAGEGGQHGAGGGGRR